MGSVNKVILVGRVGKEPVIRATQQGKEIASFSLATSEKWRDKATGEQREDTQWHNVVIFSDGLVKLVKQYVKKGSQLYIEGSLQTRKWQGNDGVDKYTTEIVLKGFSSQIVFLDSKNSGNTGQGSNTVAAQKPPAQSKYSNDIEDDELPF